MNIKYKFSALIILIIGLIISGVLIYLEKLPFVAITYILVFILSYLLINLVLFNHEEMGVIENFLVSVVLFALLIIFISKLIIVNTIILLIITGISLILAIILLIMCYNSEKYIYCVDCGKEYDYIKVENISAFKCGNCNGQLAYHMPFNLFKSKKK